MMLAKIQDAFKNLDDFYKQISLLITDTDRIMSENGYAQVNARVFTGVSRAVDYPEYWYPTNIYRVYRYPNESKNTNKCWRFYVDVFLRYKVGNCSDVEYDENGTPLIVAGVLKKRDEIKKDFSPESWLHQYWFWSSEDKEEYENVINPDAGADGTIKEIYFNTKVDEDVEYLKTFAYPLEEIKDLNTLKNKIIKPVIDLVPRKVS